MMGKPLTMQELRDMAGEPVYCQDMEAYGIIKCETKGSWANIPFLVGAWHKNGVAVNFEYDIEKRNLRCYRVGQEERDEK